MLEKTAQLRNDNMIIDMIAYIDSLDLTDIAFAIALQSMDHPANAFGLLRSAPKARHESGDFIALELSVTHECDEVSDASSVRGVEVTFVDRHCLSHAGYIARGQITPETVRYALVESAHAHAELHRDHFRRLRN